MEKELCRSLERIEGGGASWTPSREVFSLVTKNVIARNAFLRIGVEEVI
jgi:hypothetical protein